MRNDMKNLRNLPIALLTIIGLAFMATPATARDYNYVSWKIGATQTDFENIKGIGTYSAETPNMTSFDDDVTAFSIAYGYHFSQAIPLRLEIELSIRSAADYSSNDLFVGTPTIDTIRSDINSHTLFANLYLDLLPDSSPVVPYIGGGGGIAWNVWENDDWNWWDDSETTSGFAWNVGGGVALKLNNHLMLDVSYRYVDFGEAELSDLLKIEDITANEVQLGLRLTF